jgi:hypothetical protein
MYGNGTGGTEGLGINMQQPGPQAGVTSMPSAAGAANPNALPPVQRPPVSGTTGTMGGMGGMAGDYGSGMMARIGAAQGVGGPSAGGLPPQLMQALMAASARLGGGGGGRPLPPMTPPQAGNPGPVATMSAPPTAAPPQPGNPGPVASMPPTPAPPTSAGAAGGPPPGSPFSPDEWAAIQARFAARGGLFDQLGTSAGYAAPPNINGPGTTY